MPGNHHIIKETSDTLSQLLTTQFKESGYKRVHIIVNAPKPDAIEGKLPAVCVYLYQVALDEEGLDSHVRSEIVEVKQPDGTIKEMMRRAPLWVRLDYLISTWAQNPEDEQLLLGLAVQCVMENPVLEKDRLKGESFTHLGDDFYLPVTLSTRLDEGTLARFWGSLNQPVRPAFNMWTSVPMHSDKFADFKRVLEPAGIRYRDLTARKDPIEWELGPKKPVDMPPPQFMTKPRRSR
jgi:hypothetical protein